MLYQLSHIRRLRVKFSKDSSGPDNDFGSSALVRRPQVDAQNEDAILDRSDRVTDDRVVLEVGVRLRNERLPFFTSDGRKWALLHRCRTLSEPGNHLVDVKRSHAATVSAAWML